MIGSPSVVVYDYGSGNVHSAAKALERAGAKVEVTRDRAKALESDGLVVPGVGAFDAVARQLRSVRGDEVIEKRLAGGRHVLGICVGMQVFFEHGVERGRKTEGLAFWPGIVEELPSAVLPHIGWNTITQIDGNSSLFDGVEGERFYFVHSYAAQTWALDVRPPFPKPALAWSDFAGKFLAAVENGPLAATQFHPEKSSEAGIKLLKNWIKLLA